MNNDNAFLKRGVRRYRIIKVIVIREDKSAMGYPGTITILVSRGPF
jgi:hypothetical protein